LKQTREVKSAARRL